MAVVKYNVAKKRIIDGDLHFDTDDIRVLLLEAASDVNADDTTVQAVLARAGTTELTSSGYSRATLANKATSQDDTNDRAEMDCDDITFSLVSQTASETVVALLVYLHVTNDSDSIPLWTDDTPAEFPLTPTGADIVLTVNAEGLVQLA